MIWVYKHVSGKYCKFGSYSRCTLVDKIEQATTYTNEKVAKNKIKNRQFVIKDYFESSSNMSLIKCEVSYKEV